MGLVPFFMVPIYKVQSWWKSHRPRTKWGWQRMWDKRNKEDLRQ